MKTALVTGGSRGIGSAICKALSTNHKVVIGYSNSKEEAKKLVESINSNGIPRDMIRHITLKLHQHTRSVTEFNFLEILFT